MPDPTPMQTVKLDPNKPILQPATYGPEVGHRFTSSEILWWKNGAWGECGYAIPNDGGKPTTANEAIFRVHDFIGQQLFTLMHRADVKFSRPFNAEWLYDLNKMLTLGIKRMADSAVGWTDNRDGDARHNLNTPKAFLYYPVPFFGNRVRQKDALSWCGQMLKLLGEIQQHSDNAYDDNVTDFFCSMVQEALVRVQKDMALKYLGYAREEVDAPGFTVPAEKFAKGVYDPSPLFVDSELVEELPPQQWWPSTNDLTPIAGVAANVANVFAARWPVADGFYGDGGAVEMAYPGGGTGVIGKPGARRS